MTRALKKALLLWSLLALAVPALAVAAEEGGESPSLFAGDLGNSVWTLLIFVLVLVVLGKFAWGPILNTLQTRESFIREALEKAKHDREAAEARLKEYEQKLAAARGEASAIVDEGRRDADVVKRRIEAAAKEEADRMIERARREIQIATDTATKELYTLSARLATQLAAQVIGRELNPQDHARLIAEGIDGIEGASRN
ncbi:MAG TPA: F0F1 ATP synthase subunit B [Thermoanaerobaculia bacterium]|jgi:F-type H+-transporting ATPase subunit b|nr:F0F1 ATP synthase subunit B [Thermoanaerobaculia bacterium]